MGSDLQWRFMVGRPSLDEGTAELKDENDTQHSILIAADTMDYGGFG